ncbi:hypothetical protein C6P40_005247 [Pichia californica]|uniref:Uncharacterized protein n=1 Tax=Pichia californica TaxID=460514 RepID=A0A9P6WLH0_9ASCO|nr:hypothetical protein C6P40_005247 [[Candida] californica]
MSGNGTTTLLQQIRKIELRILRKWIFWTDDCESNEILEQVKIKNDCTSILRSLSELKTFDNNNEEEELKEYLIFAGKFYLNDNSLAPWISHESIKFSKSFIENLIIMKDNNSNNNRKQQVENIILDLLENKLLEMKREGLSKNVNNSGYYNKSNKIQIGGKLIGINYTKTLDKMEEFKKNHITLLGYLNILIDNYYTNLEKNWRIILPLMLSFLDDTDLLVKRESVILLNKICVLILNNNNNSDNNIIIKSQTMPLFKTAIQPLLLALPSLTPEDKSILILPISYNTILNLFKVSIKDKLDYYNMMSALLNDTILPSISKCKDYIKVLNELLKILQNFLIECDNFKIVLTKQIIYTLLTVLMDPYIVYANDFIIIRIIKIIQSCLENIPIERRFKFKYDVLGCMGTIKRRISRIENHPTSNLDISIENLVEFVNV